MTFTPPPPRRTLLSRRVVGRFVEETYEVVETVYETAEAAEPPPSAPADGVFYDQRGTVPVPMTQAGTPVPDDGSLYIAIANSIDGANDKLNSDVVGLDNDGGLHFWWNHVYGRSAGARAVFSRFSVNAGWPIGLLPYANQTIYGLLDFVSPHLAIGANGAGLWTTWPLELKAHNVWGPATVQCNVGPGNVVRWATAYGGMTIEQTPFTLVNGKTHRMTFILDMVADPAKGRFEAAIDGQWVVEMRGQMALSTGNWAGCAAFIPCLYSNQLNARTEGAIPNLVLSTQPIP